MRDNYRPIHITILLYGTLFIVGNIIFEATTNHNFLTAIAFTIAILTTTLWLYKHTPEVVTGRTIGYYQN